MKQLEKLEELKKQMRLIIDHRDGVPKNVIKKIEEAYKGLLDVYESSNCNSSSIQMYAEGNLDQLKDIIENNIGEEGKYTQLEQLNYILVNMEVEIEEGNNKEDARQNKQTYAEEILQVKPENNSLTIKIMNLLEDSLRDVQSRQNKILDARGYSQDRIEAINSNAQAFINKFINANEMKIYEMLEEDSSYVTEQLADKYEEYLNQSRMEEKSEKNGRSEFVEGLKGNISLEEQNEFAKKVSEQQEANDNKEGVLDQDVII